MTLTQTARTLLSRAAREYGAGTGLTVRPSTQRTAERLVTAGLLRPTHVHDERSGRALAVLVPTDEGRNALAHANGAAA